MTVRMLVRDFSGAFNSILMMTHSKMRMQDLRIAFLALQAANALCESGSAPLGGSEAQVWQTARLLASRLGCRTRLICLAPRDGGPAASGLETREGVEVDMVKRAATAGGTLWRVWWAMGAFGPDAIVQRAWGLETWLGARYARRAGARFIYMVAHEEDTRPPAWRRFHWRRALYARGLRAADRIIAQTQEQIEALRRHWGREAVLIRSLQPPPAGAPLPDKRGVLWVGRAVGFKRPERFLDVAERLPQLPFVMVMNATHERDYSQRMAARARRLPNMTFIDRVPYDRIMDYFERARLFIGTSAAEGFPNTYLQAFRAWTPVLSLSVDPDRIIQDRGLGFVAGNDIEALIAEVARRYDDAQWRLEAGRRAAAYLAEHHDPERIAEQWRRLLEGLR